MPTAFISYSWDSDAHKDWVRNLGIRLRKDGIKVILDRWDLVPGDQLPQFMEKAVRESDYVLIVCTRKFRDRSDNRVGGVGYEGDIMSAEVFNDRNQRKLIPILREAPWATAAPSWLKGKYYVDLSPDPLPEAQYQDLLNTLLGTRTPAPPVGKIQGHPSAPTGPAGRTSHVPPAATATAFAPIKITGVIVDQIGVPRGDGSRGSALYRVPFRLSRRPPSEWAKLFIQRWNSPPRFTTMHRRGIATVEGDKVVLDGTTVEEVQQCHRDTLILAANEANRRYVEHLQRIRQQEGREAKRIAEHKHAVEDIAGQIDFDNV
jgi:hypothetical protein